MMQGARRADFCVGYFNLRGWAAVQDSVEQLTGENGDYCRLLVGMVQPPQDEVRKFYQQDESGIDNRTFQMLKDKMVVEFAKQLTYGKPTSADEAALRNLARQLRADKLKIKIYLRRPLHAKLYLIHRADKVAALASFVGSSNLTYSGLVSNDELNVDVLEQDAANKLSAWFEERWNHRWCMDISNEVLKIIENSWASGCKSPYHIYIKTAWHLSRDAMEEANQYRLPADLEKDLLEHQSRGVRLAAQRLNQRGGVIVGDVVGLGKTLVATAIAKVFQEDRGCNVLIICPPALKEIWREHIHRYRLAAEIITIGEVPKLESCRRYHLVVIDEAHNFRNRHGKRHQQIREYIDKNDSKVILLTATPYNKAYEDIAGQLRLFNKPDEDLGIAPENLINACGGRDQFNAQHPGIGVSTLSAFEQSDHVDDWRELMRLFLIRRTRRHIKKNFAEYDKEKKRHYLTFNDGRRFYFPDRKPRRMEFSTKQPGDQYAKLYSDKVVEGLGELKLPRYGLKKYIPAKLKGKDDKENTIIDNLSRSGLRLRGFARIGLFKRLESSGMAFIWSVYRHIIRNTTLMAAYKHGKVFIGQTYPHHIEEAGEEDEWLLRKSDNVLPPQGIATDTLSYLLSWEEYVQRGEQVFDRLKNNTKDFQWLPSGYFLPTLLDDLEQDAKALMEILTMVPQWRSDEDRKLQALEALCNHTHKGEKILVFSQYKDTIEYIHKALSMNMPGGMGIAHGDHDPQSLQEIIRRFSPRSNPNYASKSDTPIRVLVATDRLSEGVNLQDAHIIVNYDLPWAIIRLIQRAGRVDRIGQMADTIYCYSALPENGVEEVIKLRSRLNRRMNQNEELVGSDEVFFDDTAEKEVREIYSRSFELEEEEGEDETDLISRAYEIWKQAIKQDPKLERVIKTMPDVVYSAKAATNDDGVIAYMHDPHRSNHALLQTDSTGEIKSQSQFHLLEKLACEPDDPALTAADNHHDLVGAAVDRYRKHQHTIGGQLGGKRNIRRRLYEKLSDLLQEKPVLYDGDSELRHAVQMIHDHPPLERARDTLSRQMRLGIPDGELVELVKSLYRNNKLCILEDDSGGGDSFPIIVCSMGLINNGKIS